jgi:hypothetical protein
LKKRINHLNRFLTSNEIEAVIKSFSTKKSPEPDGFTAKFYEAFKEEITPLLLKISHEIEREGTLQNSSYETSITLPSNLGKDTTKKIIIDQSFLTWTQKFSIKVLAN